MQNSNLIKLLKKCSPTEFRRFREYIASPFFNKNEKVRQLSELIFDPDSYRGNFEKEELSKKVIFSKLFPEQNYDRLPINNVISDLLKLLTDFLAFEEAQQNSLQQINYQISALQKKEMPILVESRARRFRQILDKSALQNQQIFFEEAAFYESLDKSFLLKQKRGFDENLQLSSDRLDVFYITSKLKIACDMFSRNTVVDAGYQCHFIEEIDNWFDNNQLSIKDLAAPKIYRQIYLMLENIGEETYYFELCTLLNEHENVFSKEDLAGIYSYVLNYCIKKINFGKKEFDLEILNLYKLLLEKELLYQNGFLTQWTFRNIVTIAIRNQDFNWANQFITNYEKRLLPKLRLNEVQYNLASLHFAQSNYSEALQTLQRVFFTDNFHQIGAKTIQLKSYFELEETEAFLSLATAFTRFLRRHRQLADYHKELNLNFVKMAKKIYLWRQSEGRVGKGVFLKKKKEILEILSELKLIGNKNWLEGKIVTDF